MKSAPPDRLRRLTGFVTGCALLGLCLLGSGPVRSAPDGAVQPTTELPLSLERTPEPLPQASVGQRYTRDIQAEGGLRPLRFQLSSGPLPEGLELRDNGRIEGVPTRAGRHTLRITVTDAGGHRATQSYLLRVVAASGRAASAPMGVLTRLDLSAAEREAPQPVPSARVWRLGPAVLEALQAAVPPAEESAEESADAAFAPPEPGSAVAARAAASAAATAQPALPPLPAGLVLSTAQQEQLALWLPALFGIEYPNRELFESALIARVCNHMAARIIDEARHLRQQAPEAGELQRHCWSVLPVSVATAASAGRAGARKVTLAAEPRTLDWKDLPGWLLPAALRDWLVRAAEADRPFTPDQPPRWSAASDCHCSDARVRQPVFAVLPGWLSAPQDPPLPLDFSLIQRITPLVIAFEDELGLPVPAWTQEQSRFIELARRHDTRIDFGVYRRDWRFLATEPAATREALVERLLTQVPQRAREFLDQPLPGWDARIKAWLPGFGEVQRTGDGLTIHFDQIPDAATDPVLAERFAEFYPRFIRAIAAALKENRQRHYAINLMMTDRQMSRPGSPFEVSRLFELLKAVEEPEMSNGRIVSSNSDYRRFSNLELRVLVLLSEPTTLSKKQLRNDIEGSLALKGDDRRVFLRSVVPLLMLPQTDLQQYTDDLVYVQDNFGGIGFWPSPQGAQPEPAGRLRPEQISGPLRTVFVGDPGLGLSNALCGVVCPNRWGLRIALEVMLLIGGLTWLVLQWQCDWRVRWGRIAMLGAIPPALLGAALLHCDPALFAVREGNAQTYTLIAILVAAAFSALLKSRVEKP
jgi:hypothetical protein